MLKQLVLHLGYKVKVVCVVFCVVLVIRVLLLGPIVLVVPFVVGSALIPLDSRSWTFVLVPLIFRLIVLNLCIDVPQSFAQKINEDIMRIKASSHLLVVLR